MNEYEDLLSDIDEENAKIAKQNAIEEAILHSIGFKYYKNIEALIEQTMKCYSDFSYKEIQNAIILLMNNGKITITAHDHLARSIKPNEKITRRIAGWKKVREMIDSSSITPCGPECFGGTDEGSQYDLKPLPKTIAPQKRPKPNSNPSSWQLVIEDMKKRDEFGKQKYGTSLQPENGRDSLIDAYQEALDLCVYLRTAIWEQDKNIKTINKIKELHEQHPATHVGNLEDFHIGVEKLLKDFDHPAYDI